MSTLEAPEKAARFRSAPFIIAALCFLMPFFTVSCKEDRKLMSMTFTGLNLVTGTETSMSNPITGEKHSQPVPADAKAVMAFGCAILGAVLGFKRGKMFHRLMCAAGGCGVILLLLLWQDVRRPPDEEMSKMAPKTELDGLMGGPKFEELFEVNAEPGFLGACAAFAVGILLNASLLRRKEVGITVGDSPGSPQLPSLPAKPGATGGDVGGTPRIPPTPVRPSLPPVPQSDSAEVEDVPPQSKTPSAAPVPLPPPAQPVARSSSRWSWVKWAAAGLVAAVVYVGYPYYVVYSLKQAVTAGRETKLQQRLDFAALSKSVPPQLVRRLRIEDPTTAKPAPVLATMASEEFLRRLAEEHLANKDGFLRLFQPLESSPVASAKSPDRMFQNRSRSTTRLVDVKSTYGSLGFSFFTSLSEFCVTLKQVKLTCHALVPEYSTEKTIALQATAPRIKLFLSLSDQTWQVRRMEILDDIKCQANAPWLETEDLAGFWRAEVEPYCEVALAAEGRSVSGRVFQYAGRDSMIELSLNGLRASGGEVRCQYRSAGDSGEAVFSKDSKGGLAFAAGDGAPVALAKYEPALRPAELDGVWHPVGGEMAELEFYGDTVNTLGGSVAGDESQNRREGLLKGPKISGATAEFTVVWDQGAGAPTLNVHKRFDGALYVALKNRMVPGESRYFRLQKAGNLPTLSARELSGLWETDRLESLRFSPEQGATREGSFVPAAEKRFTGEITDVSLRHHRATFRWKYLSITGIGRLERQPDGQLRMIMLASDSSATFGTSSQTTRSSRLADDALRRRYGTTRPEQRTPTTADPYTQTLQRETTRKMFADGQWYDLRPGQVRQVKVDVAAVKAYEPGEFSLTVRGIGYPKSAACELGLQTADQPTAEKIAPEVTRSFPRGTVIALAAPPEVAGLLFDSWDGPVSAARAEKAWITNDFSRTVTARYKSWQGVWQTSRGHTLTLTQTGGSVVGQDSKGSTRLEGAVEWRGDQQYLRARLEESLVYNINVLLAEDYRAFSGTVRRRTTVGVERDEPAQAFSAQRVQ